MKINNLKSLGLTSIVLATSLFSASCNKENAPVPIETNQETTQTTPVHITLASSTNSPISSNRKTVRFDIRDPYSLENLQLSINDVEGNFGITSFKYLENKFYVQTNFANVGELPFILRKAEETKIIQETTNNQKIVRLSSPYVYTAKSLKDNNGKDINIISMDSQSRDYGLRATLEDGLRTNDFYSTQELKMKLNRPLFTMNLFNDKSYILPLKQTDNTNSALPFYTLEENVSYGISNNGEIELRGKVYTWEKMPEREYLSNITQNIQTNQISEVSYTNASPGIIKELRSSEN